MDKFIVSIPKSTNKRTRTATSSPKGKDSTVKKQNCGSSTKKCQMFLDFGQKSFGSSKTCPKCGFFYLIGDAEDERRHEVFCKSVRVYITLSFPW
jgi:hypothetical protein